MRGPRAGPPIRREPKSPNSRRTQRIRLRPSWNSRVGSPAQKWASANPHRWADEGRSGVPRWSCFFPFALGAAWVYWPQTGSAFSLARSRVPLWPPSPAIPGPRTPIGDRFGSAVNSREESSRIGRCCRTRERCVIPRPRELVGRSRGIRFRSAVERWASAALHGDSVDGSTKFGAVLLCVAKRVNELL
jgi:hypothetical protein